MSVSNRFAILLGEKITKEKRNISIAEVARSTGIAARTLLVWYNNQITRYDKPVIEALCKYFECDVCQLIVCESDQGN